MKQRATISLFPRYPKLDGYLRQSQAPAAPRAVARSIPIRVVSRQAIEELVASINRSATNAD